MIKFKKMHGNGNDFVIIDNLTQAISLTKTQIKKIGDRKKGIGFDQLITINPPKKANHDLYIRFFNTDGSEASMCLNGVRSVGAFVWEEKLVPKKSTLLGTKSKEIMIQPTASKNVKTQFCLKTAFQSSPELQKVALGLWGVKKIRWARI